MDSPKRSGWDNAYSKRGEGLRAASKLLAESLPLLPVGKALDIACGDGRNSIFLAKNAYYVDAIDFSSVALENGKKMASEAGVRVNFIQADLEDYLIKPNQYDLIVDFNYLERSLIQGIKSGLKKGGYIVFETFTLEQRSIGHPKNSKYLLGPNELLDLFDGFHIVYYREVVLEEAGQKKAIASLVGRKR